MRLKRYIFFIIFIMMPFLFQTGGKRMSVIDGVTPVKRSAPAGCRVFAGGYECETETLKIKITSLLDEDRTAYFIEKGFKYDPWKGKNTQNKVLILIRFENLHEKEPFYFDPQNVLLGSDTSWDITRFYEFFERISKPGDLNSFLALYYHKELLLPPNKWIERLLFFKLDDNFKGKKTLLSLSHLMFGKEGFDLFFPFEYHYKTLDVNGGKK